MSEFNNFPWIEEFNKEIISTSPTISITDYSFGHKLFLSIVGNSAKDMLFHVFYIKGKKVKCIENKSENKCLEIVDTFFKRNSIKHFFSME